jgi:hypothetical protein
VIKTESFFFSLSLCFAFVSRCLLCATRSKRKREEKEKELKGKKKGKKYFFSFPKFYCVFSVSSLAARPCASLRAPVPPAHRPQRQERDRGAAATEEEKNHFFFLCDDLFFFFLFIIFSGSI